MRDTVVYGGILSEAIMPGLPDDVLTRALTAWAGLFGMVGFDLFGQSNNVITDRAAVYDHTMIGLARLIGLPS